MSTMNFAPYTPVSGCHQDGDGAGNLLWWLDKESSWSGLAYNLGVGNCRNVAGKVVRSQHARWRAGDCGLPMVNGRANPVGHGIVAALGAQGRRLGLTEMIFDRKRYHEGAPNGEYYDGLSPHYDHIHFSLSYNATVNLNVPTIRVVMAGLTPTLTPDQWRALRRWAAGDLYNAVADLPVMWLNNAPHPLYVVTLRRALNLVLGENLPADGIYDADQDWQVQRFQKGVEAIEKRNAIPENLGTFADHTKVYLMRGLANIRDGKG